MGKHPNFYDLMTGVYDKDPLKPRYCFVWDIETVVG